MHNSFICPKEYLCLCIHIHTLSCSEDYVLGAVEFVLIHTFELTHISMHRQAKDFQKHCRKHHTFVHCHVSLL